MCFVIDARQILLQTMEILAEADNPACHLLVSALKLLDKAQHTINEEVNEKITSFLLKYYLARL